MSESENYWAKTLPGDRPGISVHDHCLNVGCVARQLWRALLPTVRELLPPGAVTLAALHDVGKISTGFLCKCHTWLVQNNLADCALNEFWQGAEKDHSIVSQHCLQKQLEKDHAELWAVAVGAHHGRVHGRRINVLNETKARAATEHAARQKLIEDLVRRFGQLPSSPPGRDLSDLWLLAGFIAVADWIGSNEVFFSPEKGLSEEEANNRAMAGLAAINWSSGHLQHGKDFTETFGIVTGPNPLQSQLVEMAIEPGCYIVEGPMGCGKTEAALAAAQRLILAGFHQGIYFALPTQVTSNRIHRRVGRFLENALAERANFRLAHAASWLEEEQTVQLRPTVLHDENSARESSEARSWFASSKHALLARYGVGTIDQALQAVVAVKHFFVRRFGLAGKVVILDEVHSYDVYTGALIKQLVRELLALRCTVIVLSATLTRARRQELLECAGQKAQLPEARAEEPYPLISIVNHQGVSRQKGLAWEQQKVIRLRLEAMEETDIIEECIQRAEAGQHVLYLRNTVAEAQSTYRAFASARRTGAAQLGLLHSRFPFFRREQLETEWLRRLGKERDADSGGSILVATQIVEQSVDLDVDFIVSDLAPTDMLLQRMGRLWRHARPQRQALEPEFWIRMPSVNLGASAAELKAALGKTGRVYAPYVLLRTMRVFERRGSLSLPDQIRQLLESTYQDVPVEQDPPGWKELRRELERKRDELADLAKTATLVLGQPSLADRDEVLTRHSEVSMRPLILLRNCVPNDAKTCRLEGLDGTALKASTRDWSFAVAKLLHRNLVRIPRYLLDRQIAPEWLSLHVSGQPTWAIVREDGLCEFPESTEASRLFFQKDLGVYADTNRAQARRTEEDDEFDY